MTGHALGGDWQGHETQTFTVAACSTSTTVKDLGTMALLGLYLLVYVDVGLVARLLLSLRLYRGLSHGRLYPIRCF